MSRHILFIVVVLWIAGCNNESESSKFDDILKQPPYSSLSDSIQKQSGNDDLYFRRAVLLNKNSFPEPALADFQKAWALQKKEQYAFAISTILADKKPDSAIVFLTSAIKELPQSILLRISLARSYEAVNKTDDALRITNEILQRNPQQVDVLKMKAGLLGKKGNDAEALTLLEQAYSFTPYDVELNYVLALRYAETKNPKVLSLCDSLIKKDSLHLHADPYYYKGIYYSNINDKGMAITFFNQAIKTDYYFLNAYIEKGSILYEQKRFTEASDVFNLVMSISPKFADAYYWLAKCQEAMGQKEEAKLNYQRAYGLDKSFTEAKEAAEKIVN
ncbi:MAG TPA: tetratricopeptide repeat protein [Chitinophagaceae bacterium]